MTIKAVNVGKSLIDKLLEECCENIYGNEMLYNETLDAVSLDAILLNDYKKVCNSCTIYIVLFAIFSTTTICISSVFIYFHWYLKKDNICVKSISSIQTIIY